MSLVVCQRLTPFDNDEGGGGRITMEWLIINLMVNLPSSSPQPNPPAGPSLISDSVYTILVSDSTGTV